MTARRKMLAALSLGFAVAVGLSVAVAQAPTPATQATQGVKRTILQKMDVPGTNLETIVLWSRSRPISKPVATRIRVM